MNSTERRECAKSGEWPEGYVGSAEERLDTMLNDLKALANCAMRNDDLEASQLCITACLRVEAAARELNKCGYLDAQWPAVLERGSA